MGSTRALTDDGGDATDTYVYDAWGNEVAVSGSTVNPFRWVGRVGYYWDDETGRTYIRRRVYEPVNGRWMSQDPLFYPVANASPRVCNLYEYVSASPLVATDPSGLVRMWTLLKGDAYGVIPWYFNVGYGSHFLLSGAVGGSMEFVYNCRDGSAAGFGTVLIGMGIGTPGFSLTFGKGVNIIYNLPTASAYAGGFVGVGLGGTLGALGGYGAGFTTGQGLINYITTGSFGGETYGFGLGWMIGTPTASLQFTYEHFFLLGPIPFAKNLRNAICFCPPNKAANANAANVKATVKQEAKQSAVMYQNAFKQQVKNLIPLAIRPNSEAAIDDAEWKAVY